MMGRVKLKSKILPASACAGSTAMTLVRATNAAGLTPARIAGRLRQKQFQLQIKSHALATGVRCRTWRQAAPPAVAQPLPERPTALAGNGQGVIEGH